MSCISSMSSYPVPKTTRYKSITMYGGKAPPIFNFRSMWRWKVVSCCSPFILLHKKFRLEELIGFSDVLNLNLNLDLNYGEKKYDDAYVTYKICKIVNTMQLPHYEFAKHCVRGEASTEDRVC
jgi:hypothetical protein